MISINISKEKMMKSLMVLLVGSLFGFILSKIIGLKYHIFDLHYYPIFGYFIAASIAMILYYKYLPSQYKNEDISTLLVLLFFIPYIPALIYCGNSCEDFILFLDGILSYVFWMVLFYSFYHLFFYEKNTTSKK